jgi:hypothetical protein
LERVKDVLTKKHLLDLAKVVGTASVFRDVDHAREAFLIT